MSEGARAMAFGGTDENKGTRGARRFAARLMIGASAIALLMGVGGSALAQPTGQREAGVSASFDIPAQPLAGAVTAFGLQSGYQISVDQRTLAGLRSPGVSGRLTPTEALVRLLEGTGVTWRLIDARTVALEAAPKSSEGAVQLGPVRAEGTAGPDGSWSRDPGATEGTGSYTTRTVTIGKTPVSLRETPQSVSVITRQRMDDQNFTDLGDALRSATGVTVGAQSGAYASYLASARGNNTGIQIDGLNQQANFGNAQLDLAVYDRVEVLRGPAGLFTGAGSAGVTTNLVRKRALAPFQMQGKATGGSWGGWRAEADATGALTGSGNLRARLVAVGERRGDWLDNADNEKYLVYGTLEFDVSENGTLSVGGAWQDADAPYSGGLPAYADGRLLDVRRSTSFIADWTRGKYENSDAFVEYEHRLRGDGVLKAVLRHTTASRDWKYFSVAGAVPASGLVALRVLAQDYEAETTTADVFLSMPFELAGQTHNMLFGFDYLDARDDFVTLRRADPVATVNVFSFDPSDIPEPAIGAANLNASSLIDTESYGAYGQLRIKPFAPLTLIAGGRVSWYESQALNRITNVTQSDGKVSGHFTPYGAVVFDITRAVSLYASYAETFAPQTEMTVAGAVLPPRIGSQIEAGIKGEWLGGQLNASAAIYRIIDRNRAIADPDPGNEGFYIAAGKVRAQGFEAEISGALAPGWSIAAGYAYTETEFLSGEAGEVGQPYSSTTPKHNFKLWTHYRLPEGALHGLELGAGVRVASDVYSQTGAIRRQADGYMVAAFQVAYGITDTLKLSLNVENAFDRKYFERVGTATSLNQYGAPRSVMLGVQGKF